MNTDNAKNFYQARFYDLIGSFELTMFTKHPIYSIEDEMGFDDYLRYRDELATKIHNLYLKDFESLKDILECPGLRLPFAFAARHQHYCQDFGNRDF